MEAQKLIESHRSGAEVFHGEAPCLQKLHELLDEFAVPRCLVSVSKLEELGFNRTTGFFWLKQKAKSDYKVPSVGVTTFDVVVTCFLEQRRLVKLTGVKGKVLLVSVTVDDVLVGEPSSDKVTFTTPKGFNRVYDIAAFERAAAGKK